MYELHLDAIFSSVELRYNRKEKAKKGRDEYKWYIEEWEIVRIVSGCLRPEHDDDELHIYLREDDSDIGRQECCESIFDEVIAIYEISFDLYPFEIPLVVSRIRKVERE